MSEISKQALKVDNSTSFPNNNTGYISPAILRAFNINMIDSLVEQEGYTADSASWNVSIGQLNTYTSSFAPSVTALNAFTASQLVINTGYNSFTQSAGASITRLDTFSSSFNAYTSSINQIRSNGVTLGNSTIFNFVGPGTFFSASLVQNVQGNIATLTFSSDNAKLNTSSFNAYTQSINAWSASQYSLNLSQSAFNQSATASISQLLTFSASLDATYATDAQLNYSSSVLQGNIDKKLDTASFQSYTQSFANTFNQYTASQSGLNGTFATTGSNQFMGDQTVNGTITANGAPIIANSGIQILQGNGLDLKQNIEGSGSQYSNINIVVDSAAYFSDIYAGLNISDSNTANTQTFVQVAANSYTPEVGYGNGPVGWIGGGGNNVNGSNTAIIFRTSSANMEVYKPTVFNLGLTYTGSALGNVSASSTTSNTASIDLSTANYFTLTLTGATRINVTNAQPGTTSTLVIKTGLSGSATFSSNVKQPSGSAYIASPSGSTDILSLTSVDTNSVYIVPAYAFV